MNIPITNIMDVSDRDEPHNVAVFVRCLFCRQWDCNCNESYTDFAANFSAFVEGLGEPYDDHYYGEQV